MNNNRRTLLQKLNESPITLCVLCGSPLYHEEICYKPLEDHIPRLFTEKFNMDPLHIVENQTIKYAICKHTHQHSDVVFYHPPIPTQITNLSTPEIWMLSPQRAIVSKQRSRMVNINSYGYYEYNGTPLIVDNNDFKHMTTVRMFGMNVRYFHGAIEAFIWLMENNPLFRDWEVNPYILDALRRASYNNMYINIPDQFKIHLDEFIIRQRDNLVINERLRRCPDLWVLLFPHLFPYGRGHWTKHCGMTIQDWAKVNLFSFDGRYLQDPDFLYFLYTELELDRAFKFGNRHVRNSYYADNPNIIAQDLIDFDTLGYNEISTVPVSALFRLSASYKVKQYNELQSTMVQCGNPTLLFTFSTNAFGWQDIAGMLAMYRQQHPRATIFDIGPLVAKAFKRRWLQFNQNYILKKLRQKVGGIDWWWWTLEEHNWKTLHVHMVIRSRKTVEQLISDQLIRSTYTGATQEQKILLEQYQHHRCGNYCLRNRRCRFNYPRPLREHTAIITIDGERTVQYACHSYEDMTLVNSIDRALHFWQASMEAQYVLDGKNVIKYLNKYLTKDDRSSTILVPVDISNNETQLRQTLKQHFEERRIGPCLVTYMIMGWNICRHLPSTIYLPPILPEKRHGVLRPIRELLANPHSDDITYMDKGIRWLIREPRFRNLSYAHFYSVIAADGDKIMENTTRTIRSYFYNPYKGEQYFHQMLLWNSLDIEDNENIAQDYFKYGYSTFREAFIRRLSHLPHAQLVLETPLFVDIQNDHRLSNPPNIVPFPQLNILHRTEQLPAFNWLRSNGFQSKVLLGLPGSGKSYIMQHLYYTLETLGYRVFVLSPTGISALNVTGSTIHSFFRINTRSKFGDPLFVSSSVLNLSQLTLPDDISPADVVFLFDECGAIPMEVLACVSQKLQMLFDNSNFMGGCKTFFFGDFFQCKPPKGRWLFEYLPFRQLPVKELRTSFRHRDDNLLFELSKRLRRRPGNEDNDRILNDMLEISKNRPANEEYITLVATIKEVEEENRIRIERQNVQVARSFDSTVYGQNQLIHGYWDAVSELPAELNLVVGMRIIIIKNWDFDYNRPIRNGMFGTLVRIDTTINGKLVIILDKYPSFEVHLPRYCFVCSNTGVHRFQFPILPAYAVTMSRIQSQTLPGINLKLTRVFDHGQAYSALTRSVSLDTVSILDDVSITRLQCHDQSLYDYYTEKRLTI